jgi:hypothetical protein
MKPEMEKMARTEARATLVGCRRPDDIQAVRSNNTTSEKMPIPSQIATVATSLAGTLLERWGEMRLNSKVWVMGFEFTLSNHGVNSRPR